MNDFTYENRQGMTVLPDAIDEATGQRLEGTAEVVDSRFANWAAAEDAEQEELVEVDEDAFAPEDVDPTFEERLSDTFDEIYNADYDINPDFADSIAQVNIGDTPEAVTVKHFATQVYNGNITTEEAFQGALESGLDPDALMFHFYKLKTHFTD